MGQRTRKVKFNGICRKEHFNPKHKYQKREKGTYGTSYSDATRITHSAESISLLLFTRESRD